MITLQTSIYKRRYRKSLRDCWILKWKDPVNHQWRSAAAGKTKEEALVIEAQIRQAILRGDPVSLDAPAPVKKGAGVINSLIDQYYTSPRYLSLSPEWQVNCRSQMERIIRPEFGDQDILKLKKDEVYRYYFRLKSVGIPHTTIQKYHYKLRILGQIYAEQREDFLNPMLKFKDFDKLFAKQASTRNIDFLVPEELQRIFAELRKSSSQLSLPFVQFLASTGLRRGEALALRWSDIDRASGYIQVRTSKSGRSRTIPLEKGAEDALALLPAEKFEHVFATSAGIRQHRCSFLMPLKRAAKRAGIQKRIDIHTLRHSYGSNKIRAGWGLKKLSLLLGHADIQTTSNVYTHLLDSDLRVRDAVRSENPPLPFLTPSGAYTPPEPPMRLPLVIPPGGAGLLPPR